MEFVCGVSVVTGLCLCEVSSLWSVCVESGVCLCEVCALCIMHVMGGLCLCDMYAEWSVSVQCVWKWCVSILGVCTLECLCVHA